MSKKATLDELSGAMMARQRLIARAVCHLQDNDLALAMSDVLDCLQRIQDNERRLLQLHTECVGMVQLCHEAVQSEALRAPVVIKLDDTARADAVLGKLGVE